MFGNRIANVERGDFDGLESVLQLDLYQNELTSIERTAFERHQDPLQCASTEFLTMTSLRVLAAIAFGFTLTLPVNGASFQGLGGLSPNLDGSVPRRVSADGNVVVGYTESPLGQQAFRWTRDGGIVGLGDFPEGRFESDALGVSADGSVVVGWGVSKPGFFGHEAFRWASELGMVGLGDLPGGSFFSDATDVSDDGSVVVGFSQTLPSFEAFHWTHDEGMTRLGDVPGGEPSSDARAISGDGTVITGVATFPDGQGGYRWTAETGFVSLLNPPDYQYLYDMSSDGSVIVGAHANAAFHWTTDAGFQYLILPNPRSSSHAMGVSADGSVIVGRMGQGTSDEAFIWHEASGRVRTLQDVLDSYGVDLTGWRLRWATSISADGHTIVGLGVNPSNQQEGWIAVVPEPSSLWLAACTSLSSLAYLIRLPVGQLRRRVIDMKK